MRLRFWKKEPQKVYAVVLENSGFEPPPLVAVFSTEEAAVACRAGWLQDADVFLDLEEHILDEGVVFTNKARLLEARAKGEL